MDKDLLKFENRSDDWLAKQRKEEGMVSAWDFDEGKRIKEFHEENCEAKEIKETHEKLHRLYNERKAHNQKVEEISKNKIVGIVGVVVFVFTISIVLFLFNNTFGFILGGAIMPLLFLVIMLTILVSVFSKNGRNK